MRSCPSGKVRYRDGIAVKFALAGIDNVDLKRREQRAYRCRACKGWHLTSQARRTRPAATSGETP